MTKRGTVTRIQELLASGDCVVFLGSGISTYAGLPTGPALASDLASRLGTEYDGPTDDLEIVCSAAEALRGRNYLLSEIRKAFDGKAVHSPAHEALARMNLKAYVTTNWDTLMEDALQNAGIVHTVARSNEDVPLLRGTPVLKIHGCLQRPNTMVATTFDFVKAPLDRVALFDQLRVMMSGSTVVFLGFRLADWDFRSTLVQCSMLFQDLLPRYYAVQLDPPEWLVSMWGSHVKIVGADLKAVLGI